MHKKGEDVLNNFPKTLQKAVTDLEREMKGADSRFGISQLTRSSGLIQRFLNDPVITQARAKLRASAHGIEADPNSVAYGRASGNFQTAMKDMGARFKKAVQELRAGRSGEYERARNQAAAAKNRAGKAWHEMVASGFDPNAAQSLLADPEANPRLLKERGELIGTLQQAMVYFGVRGTDIVNCLFGELDAHVVVAASRRS